MLLCAAWSQLQQVIHAKHAVPARHAQVRPDLDPPARMLRVQLRWAIEHHQPARVRLLVEHGVDVHSPFGGDGPAWSPGDGRTPAGPDTAFDATFLVVAPEHPLVDALTTPRRDRAPCRSPSL